LAAFAIEAARGTVWEEATFCADITAAVTDEKCARDAICIPSDIAASWVIQANLTAAEWIITARLGVHDEAVACGFVAASIDDRIWGECAATECCFNAHIIPLDQAAEVIERTHGIAAGAVIAVGRWVHNAARRKRWLVWIDDHAASAIGKVAKRAVGCEERTGGVPTRRAAEWIDAADGFAAHSVIAIGRVMREAATLCVFVSAGEAEAFSPRDACFVPHDVATARIDGADFLAAGAVSAVGILVWLQAGTGSWCAALRSRNDRSVHAFFIPRDLAAVFETLSSAHGFAHNAVRARGRGMRLEATLWHSTATGAELFGKRDAHFVPCNAATGRLRCADEFAAIWARATRPQEIDHEATIGRVRARSAAAASAATVLTLRSRSRDATTGKHRELKKAREHVSNSGHG